MNKKISLCFIGLVLSTSVLASSPPVIHGLRIDAKRYAGLYSFEPKPDMSLVQISQSTKFEANGGSAYHEGFLYMNNYTNFGLVIPTYRVLDLDNPEREAFYEETISLNDNTTGLATLATDMTWDPVDNQILGYFYDCDCSLIYFGRLNRKDHHAYKIGIAPTEPKMSALCSDREGKIYAMSDEGSLYSVDKTTGAPTLIGSTGFLPGKYIQSMAIDSGTGKIYWSMCEDGEPDNRGKPTFKSGLYEVDPVTGHAQRISYFPDNAHMVGLYIDEEATPSSPEQAQDLNINFDNGLTSGTISFRLPTKNVSGEDLPISEPLSYVVDFQNNISVGKNKPGSDIELQYSDLEPGISSLMIRISSDAGKSPRIRQEIYIGNDKPAAVENLIVNVDDNNVVNLSWDAPANGLNGGYFDRDKLRYEIKRVQDGEILENEYSNTNYQISIPEGQLANICYEITPLVDSMRGPSVISEKLTIGKWCAIPFREDFETDFNFNFFSIIDGNEDGKQWEYYSPMKGAAYMSYAGLPQKDWLVTPPLHLEKNVLYQLKFRGISAVDNYVEKVRAALGTSLQSDAFSKEIVPVTEINNREGKEITAIFSVEQQGDYYIGFEAMTDDPGFSKFILVIDDISIENLASTAAPASPSSFEVNPAEKGALSAEISLIASSATVNGAVLESLEKIEIYRDENLIKTFNHPEPGAILRFTDSSPANGFNSYRAIAINQYGAGEAAETKAYIGIDIPKPVPFVKINESDTGVVNINWENPGEIGVNGGYVNVEDLQYAIRGNGSYLISNEVSGHHYTDSSVILNGGQHKIFYSVAARSIAGEGEAISSDKLVIGVPYGFPFSESFTNGSSRFIWDNHNVEESGIWSMTQDGALPVGSYDYDNGFIVFSAKEETGGEYTLRSGKINIKGSINPVLSFYTYKYGEPNLEVFASVDGQEDKKLNCIRIEEVDNGWTRCDYSLKDFINNEFINVGLHGSAPDNTSKLLVDLITIYENLNCDVAIASASYSTEAIVGSKNTIRVMVSNRTETISKPGNILLQYDENTLENSPVPALLPGEMKELLLSFQQPDCSTLYLKLDIPDDENTENNEKTIILNMIPSLFIKPSDMQVENTAAGISIKWNEPDLSSVNDGKVMKDGFETYLPFSISDFGNWTWFDLDHSETYSLSFMDYDNATTPKAFQIFKPADIGLDSKYFKPYTGEQMIVGVASQKGRNQDYLISPRLNGEKQTLSFYARSPYLSYGPECFEVIYSTSGTDLVDFIALPGSKYQTTDSWQRYSCELPAGTNYFGIYYNSKNSLALLMDDFSFIPESKIRLIGYDIYCNGVKLNDNIVTTTKYMDISSEAPYPRKYSVVAIYDKGNSDAANVILENSSVNNIISDGDTETRWFSLQGYEVKYPGPGIYIKLTGKKAEKVTIMK